MIEEWRPIVGFDGYEVSNQGRVRSIERTITQLCRWGCLTTRRMKSYVLREFSGGKGYRMVMLGAGPNNRHYVHRLVAEAFIPKSGDSFQVNHRNGVKSDNWCTNLEWVTVRENARHSTHVLGRRGGQFGPGRVRYPAGANA